MWHQQRLKTDHFYKWLNFAIVHEHNELEIKKSGNKADV